MGKRVTAGGAVGAGDTGAPVAALAEMGPAAPGEAGSATLAEAGSATPGEAGSVPPAGGPGSERRRELVAIASHLFATQGYQATTVREIAEAAGLLSGSLYHHFESKESIVDELLRDYLDEAVRTYRLLVATSVEPLDTLRQMVLATFESFKTRQAAITVYQQERQHLGQLPRFSYLQEREEQVQAAWTAVINEGIRSGAFRTDLDPRITYRFIRDAVWLAVRWYEPDGVLSVEQLGQQYLDMILVGVTARRAG